MASLLRELQRRNVFKVAAAYAIVSWLLIQIIVSVEAPLALPPWSDTLVIVLLAVGFVIAVFLAWAYELTPDGIKQTKTVPLADRVANTAGRKLDFAIIGLLVAAVAYMFVDNYVLAPQVSGESQTAGSIAVLPFENRSALEEDRFFVDGIHDELLTQLAQIGSLDKVISRTSVMEYRDLTRNLREIGTALGVSTILEGGVQRAGDRIRINVQLIDAATDNHLWAEVYDREMSAENVFEIQSEVAMAIANALQLALTPDETIRLSAVPTRSTEAYTFYQSGNDYFRNPDFAALPTAVQQFQRAVDEDPDFALAWAKLARAHTHVHWYGLDRTASRLEMARGAIEQARTRAPDLPELHLAIGQYRYMGERDYAGALEELALAERDLPNSSEVIALRAFIQRRIGQWEESISNMAHAIELDPRNIDIVINQAGTFNVLRRYAQAEATIDRALELEPDSAAAAVYRVLIAMHRGDSLDVLRERVADSRLQGHRARPYFEWQLALYSRDYDRAREILDAWDAEAFVAGLERIPKAALEGWTEYLAGRIEAARSHFALSHEYLESLTAEERADFRALIAFGEAAAMLGDPDEAVRLGRDAIARFPSTMDTYSAPEVKIETVVRVFVPAAAYDIALDELEAYFAAAGRWSIEGLSRDPRLDPIRDDPRFVALVERYGR